MGEMSWNPIPFPSYYILGKRGTISAVKLFVFEKKVRLTIKEIDYWNIKCGNISTYLFDFPKKQKVPIVSHSWNQS